MRKAVCVLMITILTACAHRPVKDNMTEMPDHEIATDVVRAMICIAGPFCI